MASTAMDARMVRTRKALHASLLKLISSRSFDEITIRDIVAEAKVGYTTFFRHYPTKESLLEDFAAGQIQRLVEISLSVLEPAGIHAACMAICRYVEAHRALWSILLNGGAQQTMREELVRVSTAVAVHRSHHALPDELGVSVSVNAMVEILAWWLRQSGEVPIEQVAKMLDCLAVSPAMHYR
jgi:AcrR family transcriptional regulator